MKTHFFNLPLRFATALCLLLLAAAHPAFGAVTYTGDAIDIGPAVIVGSGGQGSLTIDGGSSLSKAEGYVGLMSGSNGTVNVNGGNWTNSDDLYIAESGTGSLTITNGTVSNANGRVGYNAGSNGTVTVSGGNWTNSSTLTIGNSGTGSLTISNGTVSNTLGTVGNSAGSNGTVNVSGGNWTNSSSLRIGNIGTGSLTISSGTVSSSGGTVGLGNGSNGTVNVSGGNWTNSSNLAIGGFGTGSLTITNGTVSNTNGTVGSLAGSTGIVSVSGGTWANSGNLTIGSAGNGTLNLTGIGTVSVGGGLVTLANTAGKTGTLNLGNGTAAGTLSAATITGGSGTAVVNINQSGSYTLGSNMTGSLSLNHLGTGTTTLTGTNTYAGATTISAGTVQIGSANALGSGGNITFGGGTLQFGSGITTDVSSRLKNSVTAIQIDTDNNNITFASDVDATNTGGLTKLGSGNLTLTGNNTYTGGTTIKNGTMELTVGGSISSAGNMTIGSASGDNGTLTISGGNVSNAVGSIGNDAGSVGAVTVSSGNWTNSGQLYVGNGGTGNLTISGGAVSNGWTEVAAGGGSVGNILVNGGTWNSGSFYLGLSGNGTLNLSGGVINASGFSLGHYALSSGFATVASGTLANSDELSIGLEGTGSLSISGSGNVTNSNSLLGGEIGSYGTATVSGGTWVNTGVLNIGRTGTGNLTISGGSVSNTDSYLGDVASGNGVASVSGGTWANSGDLVIGNSGTGSLSITGGTVTNTSGNIGLNAGSTGVATVSGGNWTNSNYFTVGDSGNGTLNLTGGNVSIAGGAGNLTLAVNASSTGILNIGNGSAAGNLQAARVTAGSGTAIVNFNHSGNHSFSPIMEGNLSVNKLGSGTTTLSGNNTHAGGTSIQNGTLSVQAPMALGSGNVSLSAGSLLVASGQEMPGSLQIGGHFNWTGGTIAYYDTGASPGSSDMQIAVGGNFTASAGNKTFDFSQVDALNSGNYTLVLAGNVTVNLADLIATHGSSTTLNGTFSTNGTTIVYTVTGATSGGNVIQNVGGPNTPLVADYAITTSTITVGSTNTIRSLSFSNSAALTINATGQLTITSGNLTVQSGGTSVVSGGTLITSGSLAKQGAGELDLQSNTVVNGVATVVEGLLSVNAQLNANSVVVDPTATLGGAGVIVAQNVVVNGNLSPGNSPGTLSVAGNLVLTGANSTIIEIASPMNFDRIVVTGTATLGGTLNAVGYEGYTIAPGSRFDFLQAGSIVGAYDSITAPEGLRARFLNSGTVGTLLFGPGSYVMMAINQNQLNVAEALDTFILATEGDPLTVSVALDSLTTEQFPAAFDQIMPGFYESLGDILIEQTYNQAQLLTQRLGSVRLGATGFQAIGMSQPIKYDKDGKSAADAKTASPIVESAIDTNWNSWVIANGEFSLSHGLAGVPNYNNNAGGFLVGADYRLSENFAAGLFAGYEYSYAKYDGGSSTRGNSALFGLYGSYTHEDGYYADAIVSGGYTGFQTRRSIKFSTIDRTASADPNSGQFSAALNLGKDFEIGNFTLGPIVGAQYTYAGIGGFTESGAESLDLALGQQNANSLRTNLGARIAYNWEVGSNITLIPEVRGFWMHEFLNNPRNISSSLDGGSGASFDYETSAPYRNSVFGGVGISAKFADRWSASVFYNVNFGAEGYTNNIISTSLGFSF